MDIKHGIVVTKKDEPYPRRVYHFCGYEEPPTAEDIEHLTNELMNDPEFDYPDLLLTYELSIAKPDVVEYFNKQMKEDGVIHDKRH
jgi:hypothetical protein